MKSMSFAIAAALAAATAAQAQPPGPYATAQAQQAAMAAGQVTSEDLVRAALARIAELDHAGPKLNSVTVISPRALADAEAMDAERRAGRVRGPLHGVPVLIKDNIESNDGTATTAGSLALKDNVTGRDAPLVARLKAAGAVILGKTNLSEWANYRSTRSISGWSAVGGLVHNPYSLDRSACGSSSGSGAAVAAGFVAVAVGTETDGSIICPSAFNGLVGFKPTLGLVSRTHVVPISPEQDTAGPMARSVADAAALLAAMAGSDPADPATRDADAHKADLLAGLKADALKGARLGYVAAPEGASAESRALYQDALKALREAGATLVEVKLADDRTMEAINGGEDVGLQVEFKAAINAYLAGAAPAVRTRTLAGLIAFNAATPAETPLFGQEIFEKAAKQVAPSDAGYKAKRTAARTLARAALDKPLKDLKLDAVVVSSGPPAAVIDAVNGDAFSGPPSTLPAVAGYPHLTVPIGQVHGLPVGISFMGTAWSDGRLLSLGYAFEQATHAWRPPEFMPNVAVRPEVARAYDVD